MKPHRCFAVLIALGLIVPAHAAAPPTIVLVSGEDEYHSAETFPVFAKSLDDANTGYALTLTEARPVIQKGMLAKKSVSTGGCAIG